MKERKFLLKEDLRQLLQLIEVAQAIEMKLTVESIYSFRTLQ